MTLDEPDITEVTVLLPDDWQFSYQGAEVSQLQLNDRGENGDALAGDGVFSVGEITIGSGTSAVRNSRWLGVADIHTVDSGGNEETVEAVHLAQFLLYLDTPLPDPEVVQLADNVQATSHIVNISGSVNTPDHSEISELYYQFYPDDRDLMIFVWVHQDAPMFAVGSSSLVQNATEGLGLNGFDHSWAYGSDGVLKQLVNINRGSYQSVLLNHELLHRWATYFDAVGDGSYHWAPHVRDSSAFWFSAHERIEALNDGTVAAYQHEYDFATSKFNDFELYLMGLLPIESVDWPIRWIADAQWQETQCAPGACRQIYNGDIEDLSMEAFVAANGVRPLRTASSDYTFRAATIVSSEAPLSPSELAYWHHYAVLYESPKVGVEETLAWSTGGRASVLMRLCLDGELDTDGDGQADECDADDDDDGVVDAVDRYPTDGSRFAGPRAEYLGRDRSNLLVRGFDRWFLYEANQVPFDARYRIGLYSGSAWHVAFELDGDGDGDTDVVMRNSGNGLWRYFSNEAGNIVSSDWLRLYLSAAWQPLVSGDFDGDGDDDIVLWRSIAGGVAYQVFFIEDGQVARSERARLPQSAAWQFQTRARLMRSGGVELVFRHADTGTWKAFTVETDGRTAQRPLNLYRNLAWGVEGAGDFNADGLDELLLRHTDGRWLTASLGGEPGVSYRVARLWQGANWQLDSGELDVDGDGDADVFLRHRTQNRMRWFEMEDGDVVRHQAVDI